MQHDLDRGTSRPTSQVEVEPLTGGGASEAVDLPVEESVEVPVQPEVVTPCEVELAVVGLHDSVEDHVRHERECRTLIAAGGRFDGAQQAW